MRLLYFTVTTLGAMLEETKQKKIRFRSRSVMFLRLLHGAACISSLFHCIAEEYSFVWVDHICVCIYPADGRLDCFQFWAIMNNPGIEHSCTKSLCVFISLDYPIPRIAFAQS